MKSIKFLLACLVFCVHATGQSPALSFDPISVSTISVASVDGTGLPFLGPVDPAGNLYLAKNNRISRRSPDGSITIVAGSGTEGYIDGPAATAAFSGARYMALDIAGNLYVTEAYNHTVRKITPAGIVSTLAGNGTAGNQNGTGTAARFNGPHGITVDAAGNVYVADAGNKLIRKITAAGVVTTVVGSDAPGAQFIDFYDLAIDAAGNLYVQQLYGQIQKITPAGSVSTIYPPSFAGFKDGLAIDKQGNLYVSLYIPNFTNNSINIYKIFPGGNTASLAGGPTGYKDGIGSAAQFSNVISLTRDDNDNIFVSEGGGIRKLSKPVLSFTGVKGTASLPQYFSISANYLAASANVQAPAGYELSFNEAGPYAISLQVPPVTGEIRGQKIYIRLNDTVAAGVYNDSVVLSAGGALTKKLGVAGTVTNPVGTGLKGAYYNGVGLSGAPLLTRIDPVINFEMTYSQQPQVFSPAPGIVPVDMYSVRWTGQVQAVYSETYTFYTVSDDGIRLWVDGQLLVDNWVNQGATEKSGYITLVAGQKYDIKIEYYENTGESVTKLFWSSASTPKVIVPTSQLFPSGVVIPPVPGCATNSLPLSGSTIATQTTAILTWTTAATATSYDVYIWRGATVPASPTTNTTATTYSATGLVAGTLYNWYVVPKNANGTATGCVNNKTSFTTAAAPVGGGTGLQGAYYNGTALSGTPLLTRIDRVINFEMTYSQQPQVFSPAPGIVPENLYSVRWTGQVQALYNETYTFYTVADDGVRLWVNGVQLVNNWVNQGATERSGSITLVSGQKYDIVIEYYENTGESVTKLFWSSTSTPKAIVPQAQLFPPTAGARMVDNAALKGNPLLQAAAVPIGAGIYPNPAKSGQLARLQITSNKTGSAVVTVMSSNGYLISNQRVNLVAGINTTSINTAGLAQGLYLVHVTGGNKPMTLKLVVE